MGNMAAGVRTDIDRAVVMATLEALEELLKALRGGWFEMDTKTLEGLVVSIEDVLANKVNGHTQMQRERERREGRKEGGIRWKEV